MNTVTNKSASKALMFTVSALLFALSIGNAHAAIGGNQRLIMKTVPGGGLSYTANVTRRDILDAGGTCDFHGLCTLGGKSWDCTSGTKCTPVG